VRGGPRDLLDFDANAGVFALEVLHQLLHDLAFSSETPEAEGYRSASPTTSQNPEK
jgi:hypothetical protein